MAEYESVFKKPQQTPRYLVTAFSFNNLLAPEEFTGTPPHPVCSSDFSRLTAEAVATNSKELR
jgi:hypothetical protein